VSRDFLPQIFSRIFFPQAPKNNIGDISDFSKILGDIRKSRCIIVVYRYQICHRYQRHWQQILPLLPMVWLIPTANFATVTDGVVDAGGK
jgi:hypothetical protein